MRHAVWRILLYSGAVAAFCSASSSSLAADAPRAITEADCTAAKLGGSIPVSAIGEPVSGITLSAPRWNPAGSNSAPWCSVNGSMAPVDHAPTARAINFQVAFPASWNGRAIQMGGAGMNGMIPMLAGAPLAQGFVTYGSDSGHQMSFGRGGARGNPASDDWALNEEAIRNLGYLQLKKTHDAAMVLIERLYGGKPAYNYFVGSSQGGREALTVAERYPDDYNGIAANVPIVGFSSLMLGPALIRIHEKPQANWVTSVKINAIRGEFMRQCDKLDGLVDGVINNYMACRAIFDVKQSKPNRHPWAAKRCPNNVDPNPADTSADACLTDGQISTLEFVYSRYPFSQPLANGVKTFGMWLPNTDPSGSGLIANARFRSQEGAAENAAPYNWIGTVGVTGFLMQDLQGNALDYVEGGKYSGRREALSEILDSSNPDFSAFARRGGKMIVAIGTNDTLASPGTQLDFYQAILDKMGRSKVDTFARLYVLPQTGHGLTGTNYTTDGDGNKLEAKPIPNTFDRLALLTDWVEKGTAPGKSVKVTAGEKSRPMCSYPEYPKYVKGPAEAAESWECSAR
ncbi:MAG TPA: tannase/feruloyl esterase family alpha/beta hydrolase [Bryobacteraceae bacterium]|nr:tannase/feruloyl esterase family alpha/beta hydrolase [Bryobacteraceae bacterium]